LRSRLKSPGPQLGVNTVAPLDGRCRTVIEAGVIDLRVKIEIEEVITPCRGPEGPLAGQQRRGTQRVAQRLADRDDENRGERHLDGNRQQRDQED